MSDSSRPGIWPTIRNNIRAGRANATDEEVEHAAREAEIHGQTFRVVFLGVHAQRDPRDLGLSSSVPVCSARSRREILCIVSIGASSRRRENRSASGQKPESERICGTLGSLCQAGVSVEADSVRRGPSVADLGRV